MADAVPLLPPDGFHPAWNVRPLRNQGMRIPRYLWQAGEHEPAIGYLEVTWTVSDKHRRQMQVARLISGRATELLPCMRDVHIIKLSYGDLTLAGFEEIGDREYAQTWFCRLAREGWQRRGKPEDPAGRTND